MVLHLFEMRGKLKQMLNELNVGTGFVDHQFEVGLQIFAKNTGSATGLASRQQILHVYAGIYIEAQQKVKRCVGKAQCIPGFDLSPYGNILRGEEIEEKFMIFAFGRKKSKGLYLFPFLFKAVDELFNLLVLFSVVYGKQDAYAPGFLKGYA
jgi:hypothetical protein